MSDQTNTTFNLDTNAFFLNEDQNVSHEMAPLEDAHAGSSGPYYLSDEQLGGAEYQPSTLLFDLDEPLDFGMPPAWQPGLPEPGLSTSVNGQDTSGSINQNNEIDETLVHWQLNRDVLEANFQDIVNNMPAPQQDELGTIDPLLEEVYRWNAEHPYPDTVSQLPLGPSLAAQEQRTSPQDGVATGRGLNEGNEGVNPRSPELDRRDPSMMTHIASDIRQAPQDASTSQTPHAGPSGTMPSNTTAPRRDQRQPDLDSIPVQQPAVQRVAPAAVPTVGQAADLVDDGFIPEEIIDTMNEAELREYTRGLIRTNNHRVRTRVYMRRLQESTSGSSTSLPTPAANGTSSGSGNTTGSSPLSRYPYHAGSSNAVAGPSRMRSSTDEDTAAALRLSQGRRQKRSRDEEDDDEYADDGAKVDNQVDSAYNPQKKRKIATNGTKAANPGKPAKQSGSNGTNPRCQLRLTGVRQPPYNPFSGLASGRTTPQQLIRDHPHQIYGGAALAIRNAYARSSADGRCEGHQLAPLFDDQYNVNGTYVRQIFSKAKAAQAQHIKDNPDLRPRCNHCTEWYRECSLRRNENGIVPCEECMEEGLAATCVLTAQPSTPDAPSPAEG